MQAAELRDGSGDQRADLLEVGDIRRLEERIVAQRCRQRLAPVGLDVGDDDACALGHKPLHEAPANAGRAAGDDGDLAIKFVNHLTS